MADTLTEIETWFIDNWSLCPVAYENIPFDEPVSNDGDLLPWISLEVEESSTNQRSIGTGSPETDKWVDEGQLLIHIFVRANTGGRESAGVRDQIKAMFKGRRIGPIQFATIYTSGPGSSVDRDSGKWWMRTMAIDWTRQ